MAELKAIEQLLQTKELKLKKSADTCWLSVDNACQTLDKVLPAVISILENEAEEREQALAHSLCKVVKQLKFVATLYMMCDMLPVVSHLSQIFQYPDNDFSIAEIGINYHQGTEKFNGAQLKKLDTDLSLYC